jgi:hypothetical protein
MADPTRPILPILIGISGKRIFDKTSVQADRKIANRVAHRFGALFESLDGDFPQTPKVVICGAAFGADLIAAEMALERNWKVAVILAFDRVLYEEDFRPHNGADFDEAWQNRYAEHAETFKRILKDPRVLVRDDFPTLAVEGGGRATRDQLSHDSPQYDKILRRNHYEQVGQYIAEAATIMIAVMSGDERAETSEANGGTARTVAYRRAGTADEKGTRVAERSAILRCKWPRVALPPAEYVWLIDPDEATHSEHQTSSPASNYPVKVLPPLVDRFVEEVYAGHPGKDMPREHQASVGPLQTRIVGLSGPAAETGVPKLENAAQARWLSRSLVLARAFERYQHGDAAAEIELDIARPADVLESYRLDISKRQQAVNADVRGGFYWLARLFVLAVILLEIFTKFFHHSGVLLLYLLVLAAIAFIALRARWKRLSQVAEDYRTVAEILRVQRAWWSAGLIARLDRERLQGSDQDLASIRDCVKTIVVWTLLRHRSKDVPPMLDEKHPPTLDWAHVRGVSPKARDLDELKKLKKSPEDWIGGQLWFFINKVEQRKKDVNINSVLSWCLFITSGVLGVLLWLWLVSLSVRIAFEHWAHIPWAAVDRVDPSFIMWALLTGLIIYLRRVSYEICQGWQAMILTASFGVVAAGSLFLAFVNAAPLLAELLRVHSEEEAVISVALVSLVALSAFAGARRYRTERLNIEAEALEYRDAGVRFEQAERFLAPGSDPKTGAPADEKNARDLVYELGHLALDENEAWLKSRRERPLTPVVG